MLFMIDMLLHLPWSSLLRNHSSCWLPFVEAPSAEIDNLLHYSHDKRSISFTHMKHDPYLANNAKIEISKFSIEFVAGKDKVKLSSALACTYQPTHSHCQFNKRKENWGNESSKILTSNTSYTLQNGAKLTLN